MKKPNIKGFTLIELLVVVVIIGILAAIALPQYKIAVKKAHFSNYQNVANRIAKAVEHYYLVNGKWTNSFSDLDIEFPGISTDGSSMYNDKIYCCLYKPAINSTYGEISCSDKEDYTIAYSNIYAMSEGTPTRLFNCYAKGNERKVCQSLGGKFMIQQGDIYKYRLHGSKDY